ncbi:hypothetical protein CH338_13845 [Rhodoplanes elegans]|uniref:DUF1508 domain-containing protein n=2 Tax=Rhodoplanes elegans TaxID=29408 RepID=A0A327KHC5_9BRAD|nr:hypothetical protein CH338_13845 [Rhodoplanes elegans]
MYSEANQGAVDVNMDTTRYRLSAGSDGWNWQLFDEDDRLLAQGAAPSMTLARAAAMQRGIHELTAGLLFPDSQSGPCEGPDQH